MGEKRSLNSPLSCIEMTGNEINNTNYYYAHVLNTHTLNVCFIQ